MTSICGTALRADPSRGAVRLLGLAMLACVATACARPVEPSIRVDRESFADALGEGGARRVELALAEVLSRHPDDFPQPPPLDIVLRIVPAAKRDDVINSIS
jgi:hypothetical protein